MLLAIDCGNTNIVFTLFQGDDACGEWRIETKPGRTSDEYLAWFSHLLSLTSYQLIDIDGCIIASVVPAVTDQLRRFAKTGLGQEALIIGDAGVELGISIDIDMPAQAGADRLVNAFAATKLTDGPAIILDFGTATTFDLVRQGGIYAGGVIAPGIRLSAKALADAAARLPHIEIEPFGADMPIIGRDTNAAMRSGIFWGYTAMIEGIIRRIEQAEGQSHAIIATGGLASYFAPHMSQITDVVPSLTMQGLRAIYDLNMSTK